MIDIVDRPSPNWVPRPRDVAVDTLVWHYTGMRSAAAALDRLMDPASAVSAHYLVTESGEVMRLVADEHVAWHAGKSAWRGRHGLNACSIGIEVVNPGHEHGYRDFPPLQIEACLALGRELVRRWPIDPHLVVAHADIAPMRRQDPGERFPWRDLAHSGIGLWPEPLARLPVTSVSAALDEIGYSLANTSPPTALSAALTAFQRRFVPWSVTGRADRDTRCRLADVVAAWRATP